MERENIISQRWLFCRYIDQTAERKSLRFDFSSPKRFDLCWGPPTLLIRWISECKAAGTSADLSVMRKMAGAIHPLLHMPSCPAQGQLYLYLVENTLHYHCEDRSFSCVRERFSYSRYAVMLLSSPLVGPFGHIPNCFPTKMLYSFLEPSFISRMFKGF